MSSAAEWNERFARGDHATADVDPFLAASAKYWPLLPGWKKQGGSPGPANRIEALDVACGAGRHAVHLAAAGFDVTALDFSAEALKAAVRLAASRNVAVNTREVDLEVETVDLGESAFDLVAVFFYLHRLLYPALVRCLRPNGLLIYKTYTVDQLRYPGRPRHPMHLLEHNELLREFPSFRVLRYEEEWEGKGTAALVAQKL